MKNKLSMSAFLSSVKVIFFTIMLAVFSTGVLQAQEGSMSLSQMVSTALESNYDIQIYRNLQRQAENTNTVGNAGMLPVIDLTGEQSISINNSEQQFFTGDSQQADAARSESTSAQASLRWVVFDGLAMFARKDQLEKLALLSKTETRYYLEQTAADLANAYFQLKREKKLLDAFRETMEVSKARLALQEKSSEVGAGTALDLQRARVDLNTDSAQVLNQKALINELQIQINQLMSRDLEKTIDPNEEFNLQESFDLLQLIETAQKENAQLSQQQIREMVAKEDVKINRGMMYPEVELFGNYQYGRQSNEVGFLQSSQSFGPNFGVRVRFNLFNGGQQRTALENAKITVENEAIRVNQVNQEIRAAVRVAYIRWQNGMQRVELEEQSVAEADQTLKIAQKQYELGAINDVEFRTIQLNALNAEVRFLEAQFSAKSREIELQQLTGQLLNEVL
ncbi:TolC family protein [Halocola ammonii]